MEKLPQDIKLDIFSRLPAESILEFKRVSKSWLSLLEDPSFPQIHLCRQLILLQHQYLNNDDTPDVGAGGGGVEFGFTVLIELDDSDDLGVCELSYVKYDENDEQSYKIVKKIYLPASLNTSKTVGGSTMIVGSCNGLICLSRPSDNGYGDPIDIINPITREHVDLPRLIFGAKTNSKQYCKILNGFGYHPSTNEYKVVRIFYPNRKKKLGQVQVYTLGAGSGWRDKGETSYSFWTIFGSKGIHSNGKLHWLVGKGKIVAFDLADEEFHFIPSPPIVYLDGRSVIYKEYSYKLCVLGGWLGLAHHGYDQMGMISHVDIWLLKKKSTTSYDMNKQEYDCWSWSKEFTFPIHNDFSLLALTKRGEVLFWDFVYCLCCYDPKSATIRKVELIYGNNCIEAIPHINSFVSLKALGESLTEE